MNVIIISPYFPYNFQRLNQRLKEEGVNVLGIGSEPYEQLGPYLQGQLTEYYRVDDMLDHDKMGRAVAYFYHKYGKIDRLESNNEFWLEMDAYLRQEFNIQGLKPVDLENVKSKAKMKALFRKVGAPVVDGYAVTNLKELDQAMKKLKYPVVAKPDSGVGTAGTYRLDSKKDLDAFKKAWDQEVTYFIETFIDQGTLCTYDGLIDDEGRVVFEGSYDYGDPTLDVLEGQKDGAYVINQSIDPKLKAIGRKIVEGFGQRGRFFHIEFFRMDDGSYLTLEYNARIPGGGVVDSYNFNLSLDLLAKFAKVLSGQSFDLIRDDTWYTVSYGRRNERNYLYSDDEIRDKYPDNFVQVTETPDVFADLQGNRTLILNVDSKDLVDQVLKDCQAVKE